MITAAAMNKTQALTIDIIVPVDIAILCYSSLCYNFTKLKIFCKNFVKK